MKKFILPILLLMMFIPVVTNAKEYCTIVSGNGKDIGSELECGGEHFYLIDSDENNIKMLAKYNLYTGYIVDKKEELFTSSVSSNLNTYCVTKYGNGYYAQRTIANGTGERQYFCVKKELIEVEETKQNETALGAHGGYEGNPEYPEIGIVQLMLVANYYDSDDPIPYFNYNFMEYNYDESNYKEYTPEYFVDYKKYLNNQNIDIIDMKLITIDEINHIVKTATNHYLPLDEWGIESWEAILYHYGNQDDGGMYYYKVGSLKDNIDNKYNDEHLLITLRKALLVIIFVMILFIGFEWLIPQVNFDQAKQIFGISNVEEMTNNDPFTLENKGDTRPTDLLTLDNETTQGS